MCPGHATGIVLHFTDSLVEQQNSLYIVLQLNTLSGPWPFRNTSPSVEREGPTLLFSPPSLLLPAFFPQYLLLTKVTQSRTAPVYIIYVLIKCVCVLLG